MPATNSSATLSMNSSTINQLDVAGSLGITGGITPLYSTPSFRPGQIGYQISVSRAGDSFTNNQNIVSLIIPTVGVWYIYGTAYFGSPGVNYVGISISQTSASPNYANMSFLSGSAFNGNGGCLNCSLMASVTSASTAYYLVCGPTAVAITIVNNAGIYATRIA
jgi:hypothetical protein